MLGAPLGASSFAAPTARGSTGMKRITIPLEAEIGCTADTVFDVITDVRGQDRWLGRSVTFRGTVDVSDSPVRLGSTYREPSLQGVRRGRVTEFVRPTAVTFDHPMSLRPFGRIDVTQRYTLEPRAERTLVRRTATLGVPSYLRPLTRLIVAMTRRESLRTLTALKTYCDGLPASTAWRAAAGA